MKISLTKDIEPLSAFRKESANFIKRIKEEKNPIVLTQHGKSAAVLLNVEEYERLINKLELLEDLIEAKQDVQNGKVFSMEEAKARMETHLTKWK